jgi:endonuclease-3
MIEAKQNRILDELSRLFPDAKCELIHHNNFEMLVAVVLSAQTTDASVNKVTPALFAAYPTPQAMAEADLEDLMEKVRRLGLYRNKARSLKKLATALVEEYDGVVPHTMKQLTSLPGVGRKTANVVLGECFNVPSVPVDTHVERISKRLGFAKKGDSVLTVEKKLKRTLPRDQWMKLHHQFIFFGRYFCKSSHPKCKECRLVDICKEEHKNL